MLSSLQTILKELRLPAVILDSNKSIVYMNSYADTLFQGDSAFQNDLEVLLDNCFKSSKAEKVKFNGKTLLPACVSFSSGQNDYTMLYFEDCTRQDELEELNYCFSTILNSINEGVLLSDSNGIIRFYNNQLKSFEGLNPNEILGSHITEVYKVDPLKSEHLTVLKTMSPIIDRYQKYQTAQNKEVHLVASTYPILRNGNIISTYSISRNLSKVKELLKNTQLQQKDFSPLGENAVFDVPKNNTRYTLDSIIGESPMLKSLVDKARRAAQTLSPIMIYGETGTGKELFVQGIHNENSITKNQPFVAINCAAIPESLLESLLFGTVQGAFTGSMNTTGLIEQADHGTLYLDEINSMPLGLQAKLLRVLQENRYRKLGGMEELPVNCRIVSSTNVTPAECLEKALLRKDLYYRLSVISLTVPPLRERREDIPVLIEHFVRLFSTKYGKPIISVSNKLEAAYHKYTWPGNVRELEHIIEASVTMIDDEASITHKQLPLDSITTVQEQNKKAVPLSETLLRAEEKAILDTLVEYNWNISKSAAALGLSRQNLQYRMRKLAVIRKARH